MKRDRRTKIEQLIKEVRAELREALSLLKQGQMTTAEACLDHVCLLIVRALKPKKSQR